MGEFLNKVIEECKEVLELPNDDFYFPFTPYKIQNDFMKNIYLAIEEGKLGIFESPTGTGKTLSIICGALAWLKDHENREVNVLEKAIAKLEINIESNNSSSDWLSAQVKNLMYDNAKRQLQLKLSKINQQKEKVNAIRDKHKNQIVKRKKLQDSIDLKPNNNREQENDNIATVIEEDDDILLEEFKEIENDYEKEEEEKVEEQHGVKIIFCSRTHSQLSQFIYEMKKTIYSNDVPLVHLASRQIFCINKAVQKLNNPSLINEKCLEMQRHSKSKATAKSDDGLTLKKRKDTHSGCCPNLKGLSSLSEKIISSVHDVEEIIKEGDSLGACPYYATRQVVSDLAQVVVVPYNTLLHKQTREACGIQIENNIVIIDEAHNLLETVSHIHSTKVNGAQLVHACSQIRQYRDKYEKRFSPMNLLHLNQLIYVVGALIKFIGGKTGCKPTDASHCLPDTKIHTVADFIITAEIDNYNIYKLLNFCKESKITQKLHGFTERYTPLVKPKVISKQQPMSGIKAYLQEISNKQSKTQEHKQTPIQLETEEVIQGQPLIHVLSFMENLTQDYREGRVVISKELTVGKSYLKYLLLDPASSLSDVINKARSVILAGGTMQPVSEFKDRLFFACGANQQRVVEFSCGHVIPAENILPIVVSAGPTGKQLDFSYTSRGSIIMLNELGRLLLNVCTVVPAGVVCFFPSYDYENKVYEYFETHKVLAQLSTKKKIFREPKKSSQVDSVLAEFAKTIKEMKCGSTNISGALMFSVVGGKLSEGLNFSDDLGRCVIIVGMPYPNIKSPELQEKMNYLNQNVSQQAGREHYENLCMKAVNQSIGRAVRHKGDYSTMLLLDHRYAKQSVQELLPSWIKASVKTETKFGPVLAQLVKFFKLHRLKV